MGGIIIGGANRRCRLKHFLFVVIISMKETFKNILFWGRKAHLVTDDVPLKYTVTIREIYTTVEKGKVSLIIDGHYPHPCTKSRICVKVSRSWVCIYVILFVVSG